MMARTSCIVHPPDMPMVITKASYLGICEGNRCMADILSLLEYWTNYKRANAKDEAYKNTIRMQMGDEPVAIECWIWKSNTGFQEDLLESYSENTLRKALKRLEELNFISVRSNPNPKYAYDRTLQYIMNVEVVQNAINSLYSREDDDENGEKFKNICGDDTANLRPTVNFFAGAIPEYTEPEKEKEILYAPNFSNSALRDQNQNLEDVQSKTDEDQTPQSSNQFIRTSEEKSEESAHLETAPESAQVSAPIAQDEKQEKEPEKTPDEKPKTKTEEKLTAAPPKIKPVKPGSPRPEGQEVAKIRRKSLDTKEKNERFEVWLKALLTCLGKDQYYDPNNSKANFDMFPVEMRYLKLILNQVDQINAKRMAEGLPLVDETVLKDIQKASGSWENVTAAAYHRHFVTFAMRFKANNGNPEANKKVLDSMLEKAARQQTLNEEAKRERGGMTLRDRLKNSGNSLS